MKSELVKRWCIILDNIEAKANIEEWNNIKKNKKENSTACKAKIKREYWLRGEMSW